MIPVRTARSNVVMRGPTPDVGDAWSEVHGRETTLVWQPSDDERAAIAAGALVELGISQYPMPPVSLNVSPEVPLTGEGAELVDRARAILKAIAPTGPGAIPPGYWLVSGDVWSRLNATGALASSATDIPTLCGRPLMRTDATDGEMEYVAEPRR